MTNEEDEKFLEELYAIENAVASVRSGEDFVRFIGMLQKEVREDDELEMRPQLEFFQVIEGKLNYAVKFGEHEDAMIEFPDQPDWNWLARLFLIGAFEN